MVVLPAMRAFSRPLRTWARMILAGMPDGSGFYFDDWGRLLWLRTVEGIWLVADMEATYWWTLDVNCMPVVDMARLRPVTPAEATALNDVTEVEGIDPLDTYDGIAATFGE